MINSIVLLGHGSRVLAQHRQKSGKTKPLEINSQVIPKKAEKNTAPVADKSPTSETHKPLSASPGRSSSGAASSNPETVSSSSQTMTSGTRTSPAHVDRYWDAESEDVHSDAPDGWSVQSAAGRVTISQCSSSSSLEFFTHGCSEVTKSGTQTPDSEYFESSSQDPPPAAAVDKDKKVK